MLLCYFDVLNRQQCDTQTNLTHWHILRTISQSTNAGAYATEMTNTNMESDRFSDGICCSADAKSTIKTMLDFSLLKDPVFILYTVSNFLTSIGFNIPYLYLVVSIYILLKYLHLVVNILYTLSCLYSRYSFLCIPIVYECNHFGRQSLNV